MKKKLKFNRIVLIGFAFFATLVIILPNRAQQDQPGVTEDLSPMMGYQKEDHPKMESALYRLMKIYFTQGIEEAKGFAKQREIDMEGDLVRVVAEAKTKRSSKEIDMEAYRQHTRRQPLEQRDNLRTNLSYLVCMQIEAMGGKVETTYQHLVQSIVPLYILQDLADLPMVRYLRLPIKPIPLITSEGVAATGANIWHEISPYRTTEVVKVCILDAGFEGYNNLLGTELPSSVTTRSFRADGDIYASIHGTACAEIVHDMAPNANLWLVNFSTDVEHHNAVNWIIDQGVDVISYSMAWFNIGAGDGTGPICEDVEDTVDSGIVWVSAAGNEAENHCEDTFNDTDGDDWHNFTSLDEGITFYVPAYYYVAARLTWDDWGTWDGTSYSGSDQDYDLYLYIYLSPTNLIFVDSSTNWQNGTQWPTESIGYWYANFSTNWVIFIRKYDATRDVTFEVFTMGNRAPIEYNEPAGSLLVPGDSGDAVTVGAVDWSDDSYHTYSSQGPTNDGRIKPDLCAPSGVSGSTYGDTGFAGTSAATPHVAGAFALLKGKLPYTLGEIKTILNERAKDLGTSGKDNIYGEGRLNLSKASGNVIQQWQGGFEGYLTGLTEETKIDESIPKDEPKKFVVARREPVSSQDHKSLGRMYLQQNFKEKALEEFLRAIELEPGAAEFYFEVGKIYKEKGKKKLAIFYLEKYIYLGGKEEAAKELLESLKKKQAK